MGNMFEFDGFPLLSLDDLEGNYIEEYTKENIEGKKHTFQVFLQFAQNPGLPAKRPDPRSGVYGNDFAATGFYSAGCAFYFAKRYDEATTNFTMAIKLKPNHFFAYKFRGISNYELGKYDLAVNDFNKSIKLNPIFTGKLNKIDIKTLSKNEQLDIKNGLAETYNSRANAFDELGKYDLALKDYQEAIKLNGKMAEAYNNRGFLYMNRLKEYEKALKDYEIAIKLKPDYITAKNNRNIVLDLIKTMGTSHNKR